MDALVKAIGVIIPEGYKTWVGAFVGNTGGLWLAVFAFFGEDIVWEPTAWMGKIAAVAVALGGSLTAVGLKDKARRVAPANGGK